MTPWSAQTAAREIIIAHSTGWTTSTRASSAPSPRSTADSDQSTYGASACSHSAMRAAKTGEDSSRPAPMPAHCDP